MSAELLAIFLFSFIFIALTGVIVKMLRSLSETSKDLNSVIIEIEATVDKVETLLANIKNTERDWTQIPREDVFLWSPREHRPPPTKPTKTSQVS